MTEKKEFNIELYLGIIATFIALLSVAIAVWEGSETRTHNRLSVKPILIMSKTFNITQAEDGSNQTTTLQLSIVNRGLGPAIVKNVSLLPSAGGKPFNDWKSALSSIGFSRLIQTSVDLDSNSVIEPGDEQVLLVIDWQGTDEGDLSVLVEYQSMYEEPFEVVAENVLSATF
ncbi:hypothetical protein FLL45_08450 [Aliikangiella marina]|uniref:Uncharacterized protein n=1 Tax=Aliikangiella marina TaxID=1712262 RepID=A0A545TCL4_9GAMM|nr:hypothetical protein [Aliikangiella marina]TQV74963.1 hypothetical protein FLL45_08450 [Aliikangiella marina]